MISILKKHRDKFPRPRFSSLKILCFLTLNAANTTPNKLSNISKSPNNKDNFQLLSPCEQIIDPRLFARTNTLRNLTWPNGRVPYVLDLPIRTQDLKVFYEVIYQYYEQTCVRFVPKTNTDKFFILVQVSKERFIHCGSAALCYQGVPNQFIKISPYCAYSKQNWAHELGHTLCLLHEHQRLDRNEYIKYDQCPQGQYPPIVFGQDDLGTMYDYASCMHYPCTGKCWGTPYKHGVTNCGVMLHDTGLSVMDIDKINLIYNCGWCHRRRWYSFNRLSKERIASLVDFSSIDGDIRRGEIYACRAYVGDEGEVGIGTCVPSVYGWKCMIAWKNKAVIVESNFELLALANGGNKIPFRDDENKDTDYRLVINWDESMKELYVAGGRTIRDRKIYISVIHAKMESGEMGTYVGKVYSKDAGSPQNRALVVVQGKYYESKDYYVVVCS